MADVKRVLQEGLRVTGVRMARLWGAILALGVLAQQGPQAALAGPGTHGDRWTFDDVSTGRLPEGWTAEATNPRGPVATWAVETDPSAPSPPKVLALTDTGQSRGNTYNLLWTRQARFKDGVIELKLKARAGREDQGGGPIWRVQDQDNYYIARWNPLEDNFRFYTVVDGRRRMLAGTQVRADPSKWHSIRISHKGDEIRCEFDGKALKTVHDDTFPAAGGVGVWTKADAKTAFDDMVVTGTRE